MLDFNLPLTLSDHYDSISRLTRLAFKLHFSTQSISRWQVPHPRDFRWFLIFCHLLGQNAVLVARELRPIYKLRLAHSLHIEDLAFWDEDKWCLLFRLFGRLGIVHRYVLSLFVNLVFLGYRKRYCIIVIRFVLRFVSPFVLGWFLVWTGYNWIVGCLFYLTGWIVSLGLFSQFHGVEVYFLSIVSSRLQLL